MQSNPYLKKCVSLIAEKTGWGAYENWTHTHFVNLSNQIFEKSGVLISVSSLKRIFGKIASHHEPQRETRNALAKFLEYDNWDDFTSKNSLVFDDQKRNHTKKSFKASLIIIFLAVLITTSLFLWYRFKIVSSHRALEKVNFSGKYLTGTSPHTVVFQYNIAGVSDSVYINYDDDFTEINTEALSPEKNTITHRYILPDLYKVSLIYKHQAIRTIPVHLKTNGWQTYLGYNKLTKYYPYDSNTGTGKLEIDPEMAFGLGLFTKDEKVLVKHRLVKDFNINGDHCRLKAKVADLKKLKTLDCFVASFVIHGDSGKINISFAQDDCLEYAYLKFGKTVFSGKNNELTSLLADFTTWQDLEIEVGNHKLTIKINNAVSQLVYFPESMGEIRSLLFDTSVSGALDWIEFTDTKTGEIYFETF